MFLLRAGRSGRAPGQSSLPDPEPSGETLRRILRECRARTASHRLNAMEIIRQLQQHLSPFAVEMFKVCVWLLLLLVIFGPLERLYGLHRQKVFRKAFLTDLGYYFLNSFLPKLLWSCHCRSSRRGCIP